MRAWIQAQRPTHRTAPTIHITARLHRAPVLAVTEIPRRCLLCSPSPGLSFSDCIGLNTNPFRKYFIQGTFAPSSLQGYIRVIRMTPRLTRVALLKAGHLATTNTPCALRIPSRSILHCIKHRRLILAWPWQSPRSSCIQAVLYLDALEIGSLGHLCHRHIQCSSLLPLTSLGNRRKASVPVRNVITRQTR